MQFDATETLGELAKLPPETPKPVEAGTTAGGLWRAVRNAVPAAVAESAAMVAKGASIAFDDSPDNRGPVRQFGEEVERSLRNVAESYGPDPMTASKAEQVVFGLTRGVGKAVGYGLTTGPAAPFLFGADEGLTEREKLLRQGVDEATATKVGALAGAVNVAGFAIPVAGSTVARTMGLAALSGPASFVAQQSASRYILANADYDAIAQTYDPTDAWGLGLSMVPFGFGAWAMRGRMRGAKPGGTEPPPASDKKSLPVDTVQPAITTSPADAGMTAASAPPMAGASGGIYTLSDAISADGPTSETVKLIVRDDGTAAIQRENGDVIDVTNMIRAGFSAERAIAQALGDDTSGANVAKIGDPSARPEVVPMEQGARAEEPPIPVEPVATSGVSPDIPARSPDVVPASPDVPERVMPQEYVDAAMVKHLTDASEYMRVWESPPMESLEAFAARVIPKDDTGVKAGKDEFLSWLKRQGGVNFQDKFDITGEANAIRLNRGGVFKKRGRGLDDLAIIAESEGWLPPGAAADIDGGVPQLREMIRRSMAGERIKPLEAIYSDIQSDYQMRADEMQAEALATRLELLGVDPSPAQGRLDVLQAYLDQHEPRLIRQSLAEAGQTVEPDLPAPTAKEPAANVPPPQELGTQAREAPKPEGQAQGKAAEGQADPALMQSVRMRADEVAATAPDLVVGLAEDGTPITAKDALERIRREAQNGTDDELGAIDAPLVKIAMECALRFGE